VVFNPGCNIYFKHPFYRAVKFTEVGDRMSRVDLLYKLADSIKNDKLRSAVYQYLNKVLDSGAEKCVEFEEAPGEIEEHHSYPGGLLEHTVSVAYISSFIADLYENVYGFKINKDMVIACSVLHDLYKVFEFEVNNGLIGRCRDYYPHDARLSGEILVREGLPELAKCITELHGYYGYTSLESLIVGLSDILDAKFHSILQAKIRNYLSRAGRGGLKEFYEFMKSREWVKKDVLERILITPP